MHFKMYYIDDPKYVLSDGMIEDSVAYGLQKGDHLSGSLFYFLQRKVPYVILDHKEFKLAKYDDNNGDEVIFRVHPPEKADAGI